MAGMDRHTGGRLGDWAHIAQALGVIFTTRIGTRVERRSFGSGGPELQDAPANPDTILAHFVALATAIDLHEPRVSLEGFGLTGAGADGTAIVTVVVREIATGVSRTLEVA